MSGNRDGVGCDLAVRLAGYRGRGTVGLLQMGEAVRVLRPPAA